MEIGDSVIVFSTDERKFTPLLKSSHRTTIPKLLGELMEDQQVIIEFEQKTYSDSCNCDGTCDNCSITLKISKLAPLQ
jgi:hypothetical protein